jgi:hypothetical protein
MSTNRKIVSQLANGSHSFPSLGLPMHAWFEEDTVIDGHTFQTGDFNPHFPTTKDKETIELVVLGNRVYHSVHGDYTLKMLTDFDKDNDYKIETELDGNFTYTCLAHPTGDIKSKYAKEPSHLEDLGLPAYDKEIHTDDLMKYTVPNAEEALAIGDAYDEKSKQERIRAKEEADADEKEVARLAADLAMHSAGLISNPLEQ